MIRKLAALGLVFVLCTPLASGQSRATTGSVPIIYSTDLYHPHQDPDDHFDLVTLFALDEFDLRAIVIDLGKTGANRPGIVPLKQIMHITGRTVPYATGLIENLKSPEDLADDRSDAEEAGVQLIIDAIGKSEQPVTVFCTGSLRDVAAAYNRAPELFRAKVARLYINAGHSGGGREYNVRLDPNAYVRILRSPLPVYWVPCFGSDGYFSRWSFRQGVVLDAAPQAVQSLFVYALTKASPETRDPIAALDEKPAASDRKRIWALQRNMWCTGAFLHAAGRGNDTFSFNKIGVKLDDNGVTTIDPDSDLKLPTFHRKDETAYANAMRETLRELFAEMRSVK